MYIIDTIRRHIRSHMNSIARFLSKVSHNTITPNSITYTGLVAHIVISYFIATGHLLIAGILLIFFGLFDALDGALARYQKIASPKGMFLDATTDRIKEVIIYASLALYFSAEKIDAAVWLILALGVSVSISYAKAKGESALITNKNNIPHAKLNRIFSDGLASFEIRMVILIAGLFFGQVLWAVWLICIIGSITLLQRCIKIYKALA